MPWEPHIMRSVNRRDIFPALGTVLLGGIATASLAKPESLSVAPAKPEGHKSDAHLIALCSEFLRLDQAFHEVVYAIQGDDNAQDTALAPIIAAQGPLLREIVRTKARSVTGLKAKAHALTVWDGDPPSVESEYWDESLTASILRDLLTV